MYTPELRIPLKLIRDRDYLKFVKKPEFALFLYLQTYIARGANKYDYFDLYNNYYKKGLLAVQQPESELAYFLGVDERTIIRWIKKLNKRNFIKIEKKLLPKTDKQNTEYKKFWNIYILGTVNNKKTEELFYIKELVREDRERLQKKIESYHLEEWDTCIEKTGHNQYAWVK